MKVGRLRLSLYRSSSSNCLS